MLGLIEKDLRLTLIRKQTLLIFFAVALIMGISMEGSFIIGYLTILATIVAVGTISYDEFDNGFAFLMTLPFNRKTYVKEKYLFSLILAVLAWCFGVILNCIGNLIRHDSIALMDRLPILLVLLPALYLSAAVMIPLQLKYGSEKSRIVLFTFFGIIAILIFASKKISENSDVFARLITSLEGLSPFVLLAVIVLVCLLLTFASYLWSIRIIKKKEF